MKKELGQACNCIIINDTVIVVIVGCKTHDKEGN